MIDVILTAAGVVLLLFICVLLSDWISLGFFRVRHADEFSSDALPLREAADGGHAEAARNYVERQQGESCGGYAAAYVLRHFGMDVTGEEVYAGMIKVWKGRVWVREVRRQLEKRGFKTKYWRGTPETLRRELDKGDPVILLLNTAESALTLHFAAATGYDEGHFFLADSAKPVISYSPRRMTPLPGGRLPEGIRVNGPFNRVVTEEELLKTWDTGSILMPFHRFTYVTVENGDQRREHIPGGRKTE